MRSNFSHQGRTAGGRFTYRSAPIDLEAGLFPEDSAFWRGRTEIWTDALRDMLGDDYETFTEALWPGDSIMGCTYRRLAKQAEAAWRARINGETNLDVLVEVARRAVPACDDRTAGGEAR